MSFHQQWLFVRRADETLQRYRTDMSISHYIPLSRTFVVANTVTGMQLENRSLTFHDLIKVGGTYTIRGFFEDTFAGNTIMYTNTELRLLMTRQSRFFLFMDYGYVEDNRPDFRNRFTDLFGFGIGLRADSRIGLLRIDYGFHHAQGQWMNPMNGIVHFGIETSF
jgi:hemolysin activation/secretion protein